MNRPRGVVGVDFGHLLDDCSPRDCSMHGEDVTEHIRAVEELCKRYSATTGMQFIDDEGKITWPPSVSCEEYTESKTKAKPLDLRVHRGLKDKAIANSIDEEMSKNNVIVIDDDDGPVKWPQTCDEDETRFASIVNSIDEEMSKKNVIVIDDDDRPVKWPQTCDEDETRFASRLSAKSVAMTGARKKDNPQALPLSLDLDVGVSASGESHSALENEDPRSRKRNSSQINMLDDDDDIVWLEKETHIEEERQTVEVQGSLDNVNRSKETRSRKRNSTCINANVNDWQKITSPRPFDEDRGKTAKPPNLQSCISYAHREGRKKVCRPIDLTVNKAGMDNRETWLDALNVKIIEMKDVKNTARWDINMIESASSGKNMSGFKAGKQVICLETITEEDERMAEKSLVVDIHRSLNENHVKETWNIDKKTKPLQKLTHNIPGNFDHYYIEEETQSRKEVSAEQTRKKTVNKENDTWPEIIDEIAGTEEDIKPLSIMEDHNSNNIDDNATRSTGSTYNGRCDEKKGRLKKARIDTIEKQFIGELKLTWAAATCDEDEKWKKLKSLAAEVQRNLNIAQEKKRAETWNANGEVEDEKPLALVQGLNDNDVTETENRHREVKPLLNVQSNSMNDNGNKKGRRKKKVRAKEAKNRYADDEQVKSTVDEIAEKPVALIASGNSNGKCIKGTGSRKKARKNRKNKRDAVTVSADVHESWNDRDDKEIATSILNHTTSNNNTRARMRKMRALGQQTVMKPTVVQKDGRSKTIDEEDDKRQEKPSSVAVNHHSSDVNGPDKTGTRKKKKAGKKPLICLDCHKEFQFPSQLKTHCRIHTLERPFKCCICDKGFKRNSHLETHMLHHENARKYKCATCNKSFNLAHNLYTHTLIHLDEKPHVCNVCDKKFRLKIHLKQHKITHSGVKPFVCMHCDKDFTQKGHLRNHLRIHSGEKPYLCKVCKRPFADTSNLRRHMLSHTGEKPFKCCVCNRCFSMKKNLKRHFSKCHN